MNLPSLNVIGAGQVGQTLARLFHLYGCFTIQGIFNRTLKKAKQAVAFIEAGIPCSDFNNLPPADVYLLTTPDSQLSHVAHALLSVLPQEKSFIIFHCSGALPSTVLDPLKAIGAKIASMHPLMTFAKPNRNMHHFNHISCAFEGDKAAFPLLKTVFTKIGGKVFSITTDKKALYHIAAVMVCNYWVTLVHTALELYKAIGLDEDDALTMLKPIVKKTMQNVFAVGPMQALTGPLARADQDTIQYHLKILSEQLPLYKPLYALLGLHTLKLVKADDITIQENLTLIETCLKEVFETKDHN